MEVKLRQINGNWDRGFALHKHTLSSEYVGDNEFGHPTFSTKRSGPGEALYQLKYQNDWSQVKPLAKAVFENIVPLIGNFGLIVPMPATNTRRRQPVEEIAQSLGNLTGKPVFSDILTKSSLAPQGKQIKDLTTKDEKVAALAERLVINPSAIANEGCWNVLLIDDLFDTGASMEAACKKLKAHPKIDRVLAVALTWK